MSHQLRRAYLSGRDITLQPLEFESESSSTSKCTLFSILELSHYIFQLVLFDTQNTAQNHDLP